VIIALLRFIYLTLPNCAGIELKTLNKEEKQRKSTKANSPWRVKGDQRRDKAVSIKDHSPPTRNGE